MDITTLELWPNQAKNIINEKRICMKCLLRFSNIIFPWNNNYDQQRQLFSTQIQERPLFIIKAIDEREIIKTLKLIKKYDLTIRIVGGRHSTLLQNPDVFLDISLFTNIKLEGKHLTVGAGLTQGQVNDYLFKQSPNYCFVGGKPNHPSSFGFPGGSAASVGVAGISTVGGIGTLRRTLGLTIDSIVSFKIITPKELKVTIVSKKENIDLFWALRGGGANNFGIVTEIQYKIAIIYGIISYEINWKWKEANEVITLWQQTAVNRSNKYNEDLSLFAGKDYIGINLTGIYVLSKHEKEEDAIQNIKNETKKLGGNLIINPSHSYADLYTKFVNDRIYHSYSNAKIIITRNNIKADDIIKKLEEYKGHNGNAYIGLQLLGGKISNINKSDTCYYPRQANFFIDIFNFWDNVADQKYNLKWNNEFFNTVYSYLGPYIYLGFPINDIDLKAYYGNNYYKWLKIKDETDPSHILC